MSAYPTMTGGNIGAVLRKIQEERAQSPSVTPPSTEPGNPIRELTVTPPTGEPESPGSSRVVGMRPEASVAPGVSPVAAGAGVSGGLPVVPPRMTSGYGTVGGENSSSTPSSSPSQPDSNPAPTQATPVAPRTTGLGTKITSSPQPSQGAVLGANTLNTRFSDSVSNIEKTNREIAALQEQAAALDRQLPAAFQTRVYPTATPAPSRPTPSPAPAKAQPKQQSLAQKILSLFGFR